MPACNGLNWYHTDPMSALELIGVRITNEYEDREWSQSGLALHFGVSYTTVHEWGKYRKQ